MLVAPTDCVLSMIQPLKPDQGIPTKLGRKLDVRALLDGSGYAKRFEHGSAVSCILLPSTYHHFHAVGAGKVVGFLVGCRRAPAACRRAVERDAEAVVGVKHFLQRQKQSG